ncbi:MAG TPA: glycosyltransferase family 9 protein [Ignavibacteriaceae bacterium]|nr:glycosyltransferase family 9 protein [Ignavibacteriaceae bacterium]
MHIKREQINKILIIKPRGIGDVVLSTIVLDNLVIRFPSAIIDYLTEEFARPVLENNPLVNKILIMGKSEFSLKVAWRIRKEKYDMILDLWSNPRTAQITFFSGAKYRVGFAYRGRKYAYNIKASEERGEHHSAEHNLELLKAIDVPIISKKIHCYVSELNIELGRESLNKNLNGITAVGIIPSGGWPSKRCDAIKWVEICKTIKNKYDVVFLILWGPGDEIDAEFIYKNLPDETILAPQTDLSAMMGLIKNCDMIIANDSGPMHIAAALGIPTLGIFGPTNPKAHGPYSENSAYVLKEDLFCIICNRLECPYHHECMLQLENGKVLEAFEKIGKGILI